MRKNDQERSKIDEFFKSLKELMKTMGKEIKFSSFRSIHRDESSLSKMMDFLSERIRTNNVSEVMIEEELKKMLQQRKINTDEYRVEKNSIIFVSKYKNIVNQETLIKEIEKYPKGLCIDQELLKLTHTDIKQFIQTAINYRKIFLVRSKDVERQKDDDKYLGSILFGIPPEIKPYAQSFFKIKAEDIEKQIQKQRKIEKRLQVKTGKYRDFYEKSCKENLNERLKETKNDPQVNERRTNSQWEEINRNCIENYDQLIEEYMRKINKK